MPEVEDGGNNNNQKAQQYEALGTIQIVSFTANPPAVTPFAQTTLSWVVAVPHTLHAAVQFVVAGKTFSGTSGSVTTQVVGSTEFGLTAKTPIISRAIGFVTVTSDTTACASASFDAVTVQDVVNGQVNQAIPASDQFSFRGDGPSSKLGLGTVTVSLPLNINVPDWFDAQADVSVVLNVKGAGKITDEKLSVSLGSVNVNVNWNLASQILSLGCEHFISNAMQTLAEAFLTQMINAQVVPQFRDSVNALIANTAATAKAGDPHHRTFVLTSFSLSTDGLSYTVCPKPNPPGPPQNLPSKHTK